MTFIESWVRRCARRNADRVTISKTPTGAFVVSYGDHRSEVVDSTPDHETTLRDVRVAVDRLMNWGQP
jgi:hypothetical protein